MFPQLGFWGFVRVVAFSNFDKSYSITKVSVADGVKGGVAELLFCELLYLALVSGSVAKTSVEDLCPLSPDYAPCSALLSHQGALHPHFGIGDTRDNAQRTRTAAGTRPCP